MRRLGLFALLLLSACDRAPKPDLLLITIDTLRADRLGSYGYAQARTPFLDQLAREGVRFAQCMSPAPITLPAHASMLTGQLPHEHGVRNNLGYALPKDGKSVALELRDAGYQTAAFVSAFPLDSRFGLDLGFAHYDDAMPKQETVFEFAERPAPITVQAALKWISKAPKDAPLFVWVHLFEPHAPYAPPEQLAGSFAHPYDGEITASDAAVRVLVAGFAQLRSQERITIVTSDHGEGLGEHDEDTHSFFLYETTLHVPLIVHAPRHWSPAVIEEPVSLCDVAPTLRSFAKLRDRGGFGQTLRPDGMPRRTLYAESLNGMQNFGWSPVFARREGPQKLIRSALSRAYDLASDPQELQDLLPAQPEWAAAALGDLEAVIHAASEPNLAATRGVSPEESEALAALGYMSGGAATDAQADLLDLMDKLPDGTAQRAELLSIVSAQNEITARRYAEAVPHLKSALESNPGNAFAQSMLATNYDAMGELEQAAMAFERAISLAPRQLETRTNAARVFYRMGQPSRAAENYKAAIAIDPQRLSLWREAAPILVEAGEIDALLELLRQRIAAATGESAPERSELHALYAVSCLQSGRAADAMPHIAQARELADSPKLRVVAAQAERLQQRWDRVLQLLDPLPDDLKSDAQAHLLLGLARDQTNDLAGAMLSYRRALELDERLPIAHARLATHLLYQEKDPQAALPHAARAVELAVGEAAYHQFYVELLEQLGKPAVARSHVRRFASRFAGNAIFEELKTRYGVQ